MEEKSFCAKWIAPHGTSTLPVLRKRFFLADAVASAKIFISGLGLFELHINGRKAHDTYFEPGESVYEKTVFYSVFDATSHLRPGENEITVYLGNGFYYNPPAQTDRLNREPAILGEYMLLCQLEVNDLVYLCSDESWECADGPITESVWLGGETYDATVVPQFDKDVKVVEHFPLGHLKQRLHPPVKAIRTIHPQTAKTLPNGNTLIDFGMNFAGTYIFQGKGRRGQKITFWFGEVLKEDGSVDQRDFWGNIYDTYIFADEAEVAYSPKFVYHGFRYIEAEGIACDASNFTGILLHCDNPPNAAFQTDNETVNAIHKLIARSIEDNMQSVLTDCPHREKLGWTEVYHLLYAPVNYNFHAESYYKKLILDLMDAQKENGSIPSIVPPFTKGIQTHALRNNSDDETPNDPSWCGALVFAAYQHYLFYGDKQLLGIAYPHMQRYMRYISVLSCDHLLPKENLNRDLGDWMSTDKPSVSFVVSCVYYRLYDTMAKVADILGKADDYSAEKERIKNAVNKQYFRGEIYDNGSQSAVVLALSYGIADPEQAETLAAHLASKVIENNCTLTVGEVALKPFFDVLCAYGYGQIAWRALMNAYGGFSKTHTTLPESWSGKHSQNHAMLGAGDAFFVEHLAGVQNAGVAFDRVKLQPFFPEELNECALELQTNSGRLKIHWKRTDGKIRYRCEHDETIQIELYTDSEAVETEIGGLI